MQTLEMPVLEIPKTLIYPSTETETTYTNVLLVSNEVQEYQQFIDSANSSTFPIVYSKTASKTELLELLKSKFSSILRMALVFHSSGKNVNTFLEMKPLFDTEINENAQFIIDLIKEFQIKNIDYLACNTLNYSNWVNYYNTLTQETGVTVGASNDRTGNIKYGGDWVLESTNEDIETVYFTNAIKYYQYILAIYTPENSNINYTYTDGSGTASVTSSTSVAITEANILSSFILNNITYNVTSIGDNAFANCSSLRSVSIPNSVTSIGANTFRGTGLTSVSIPNSVTSIGANTFRSCTSLTSVSIPNSVRSIGDYAFYDCTGLRSVSIPNSVTSIGANTFRECRNLTSVSMPNLVTSISTSTFHDCVRLTSIIIPNSVTSIGFAAFANCSSLPNVTIPNSVTIIGTNAFSSCTSLTSVTISNSVRSIGNYAFHNCTGLTRISIPNSVTIIGTNAFQNCTGLTRISIPNSVTSIGDFAFADCNKLTSVSIPNSVTSIGSNAFQNCTSITTVYITDTEAKKLGFAGSPSTNNVTFYGKSLSLVVPTVIVLKTAGYSIKEIYEGGFTVPELYEAGVTENEIVLSNICFPKGTPIKTDQGNIAIEKIDKLKNTIHKKKIIEITQTKTEDKYIVCIEKDALGNKIPSQETRISKNHEILYKGKMKKAKELIGLVEGVYKVKYTGEVLYNVLMEEHEKMLVNNMICETLNPENTVAELYKILNGLSEERQEKIKKQYNEYVKKNKTYTS